MSRQHMVTMYYIGDEKCPCEPRAEEFDISSRDALGMRNLNSWFANKEEAEKAYAKLLRKYLEATTKSIMEGKDYIKRLESDIANILPKLHAYEALISQRDTTAPEDGAGAPR